MAHQFRELYQDGLGRNTEQTRYRIPSRRDLAGLEANLFRLPQDEAKRTKVEVTRAKEGFWCKTRPVNPLTREPKIRILRQVHAHVAKVSERRLWGVSQKSKHAALRIHFETEIRCDVCSLDTKIAVFTG